MVMTCIESPFFIRISHSVFIMVSNLLRVLLRVQFTVLKSGFLGVKKCK